jgi:hypothetical protein
MARSASYVPQNVQQNSMMLGTRRRRVRGQGSNRQCNIRPSALCQMQQTADHTLVLQLGLPWTPRVVPPATPQTPLVASAPTSPDTPNSAASAAALSSWSTVMVPAPWSRHVWMPRKSSGSPISGSQTWTPPGPTEHVPLPQSLPPSNHHLHKTWPGLHHPSHAKSTKQGRQPIVQTLKPSAHPPGACSRRAMPASAHAAPAAVARPVYFPLPDTLLRTVGAQKISSSSSPFKKSRPYIKLPKHINFMCTERHDRAHCPVRAHGGNFFRKVQPMLLPVPPHHQACLVASISFALKN